MALTSTEKHQFAMAIIDVLNLTRNATVVVGSGKETVDFREHALEAIYLKLANVIVPSLRKADLLDVWTDDDWEKMTDISQLRMKHDMPQYTRK